MIPSLVTKNFNGVALVSKHGSKHKRQVRKMVELLCHRYNVFSIYAKDIASCLEYPLSVVEEELQLLHEDGVLEPIWELHCGQCGSVAVSYELPELFHRFQVPMIPCEHCMSWLETEGLSEEDLVLAYHLAESGNSGDTNDEYSPFLQENDVTADWEGDTF